MINKKLISNFADIIGNLEIAIHLDSFKNVECEYKLVLNEMLKWVKYYYANKNLEIITHEKSLEIHELLEKIKWDILPSKEMGIESLLADNILIRYEVIIKTINKERGNN